MKDVEKFKKFLTESGAVVQPPTNQWEVVRFRTVNGTSVVYENKRGQLTFTGESQKAYQFFKDGRRWKAVDRERKSLKALKVSLAQRDGKKCFFHGATLDYDQLTIEHLLEFSKGGSDHPFNLCLACDDCNKAVVGMTITEKMQYRDKMLFTPIYSIDPSYVTPTILDEDIEIDPKDVVNGVLQIKPGEPIILKKKKPVKKHWWEK